MDKLNKSETKLISSTQTIVRSTEDEITSFEVLMSVLQFSTKFPADECTEGDPRKQSSVSQRKKNARVSFSGVGVVRGQKTFSLLSPFHKLHSFHHFCITSSVITVLQYYNEAV